MNSFSDRSKQQLETCDPQLQELFNEVIKYFDCTILVGTRTEQEQNEAYEQGRSKLKWPQSKHNTFPSKAVDVAPYPIDWEDTQRFNYFAGVVMGIAASKGIKIRWGGDWDRDTNLKNNKFNDLPHFELYD